MTMSGVKTIQLRAGFQDNWARLGRRGNPTAIAMAVLNDPDGIDTVMQAGLPISWHQRVGRYNGEEFRVVYVPGRDRDGGRLALVSYIAPA
jgi:hypothetical protein